MRVLASPVIAFTSDGRRDVAWQTSEAGPITVFDALTGRRAKLAAPPGCTLEDQGEGGGYTPTFAAGRLFVRCLLGQGEQAEELTQLLDVHSGKVTPLPLGTAWYALGRRYARGNDVHEHQVVIDLHTRAIRRVGEEEYVDLDRSGAPGPRVICPRLRALVHREGLEDLGNYAYADGVFAARVGFHGAMTIAHCHGAATILRGQRFTGQEAEHVPKSFDLRGGVLSWDTGNIGDTSDIEVENFQSRLNALDLRSGRRRTWVLPRLRVPGAERGAYGYSTHTGNAVFWAATRTVEGSESGAIVATMTIYWSRW